jgi:hypothetical protein
MKPLLKPALASLLAGGGALFFLACFMGEAKTPASSAQLNGLRETDKAAGWRLLFDGKTTAGWRGFRKADFPHECWRVEEGALKRIKQSGAAQEECGDIVTVDQFDNFEFQLQWKIEAGGNSGVKYLVREDRPPTWEQAYLDYHMESLKKAGRTEPPEKLKPERWKHSAMGFELQLIDDQKNADARGSSSHITGALYDLIPPTERSTVSLTDFNTARIVVRGKHVEHWINGVKVLEFENRGPQLQARIAASKFQHLPGFGSTTKGHIALQDHNSEVLFRNIKIRQISDPEGPHKRSD